MASSSLDDSYVCYGDSCRNYLFRSGFHLVSFFKNVPPFPSFSNRASCTSCCVLCFEQKRLRDRRKGGARTEGGGGGEKQTFSLLPVFYILTAAPPVCITLPSSCPKRKLTRQSNWLNDSSSRVFHCIYMTRQSLFCSLLRPLLFCNFPPKIHCSRKHLVSLLRSCYMELVLKPVSLFLLLGT